MALEPQRDRLSKKMLCRFMCWLVPVAFFIRLAHMIHSRVIWSVPLLILEMLMVSNGGGMIAFGLRDLM